MRENLAVLLFVILAAGCGAPPVQSPVEELDPVDNSSVNASRLEVVRLSTLGLEIPRTLAFQLNESLPVAKVVLSTDRPWWRLKFLIPERGPSDQSILIIRSQTDSCQQTLTVDTLRSWGGQTIAFNGPEVELLYLDPSLGLAPFAWNSDTPAVTLLLSRADEVIGPEGYKIYASRRRTIEPPSPPPVATALCNEQDGRQQSAHPWVGRIVDDYCTAFMVGPNQLLTAHHCIQEEFNLIQFNVPDSTGTGNIKMPACEDQYMIKQESIVRSSDTSDGNDWAIFSVLPNTETGKLPNEKQEGFFSIAPKSVLDDSTVPRKVTVIGYGWTGSNKKNQTQQSHSGDLQASEMSSMGEKILHYQVDTSNYNSGSPVILHDESAVIGIHTDAGCIQENSDSANGGTWIHNEDLANELATFVP